MLSDHEFLVRCDPVLGSYEKLTSSTPTIPDDITPRLRTDINPLPGNSYKVTDIVHAIPAGIWDTNVVSTYEFTDIDTGLFVRVKSPLSIIIETTWEVKEGEGDQGLLELTESVSITCSRFLVGTVKSQCDSSWKQMHAKLIERLKADVENEKKKAGGE